MRAKPCVFLFLSLLSASAHAFTITAVGNVTALTDKSQMLQITGQTSFEEGPPGASADANTCAAEGLFWYQGVLSQALPGVMNNGMSVFPMFVDKNNTPFFPNPAGGGSQTGNNTNYFAGVATFNTTITQLGLTASTNGDQYLTAWDQNGTMLGQVNWHPVGDSSFIGIDTKGVPIGLIAYGNHDVWNGQDYGIGGATIISDDWVWGPGAPPKPCMVDADCSDNNPCNGIEFCDPVKKTCAVMFLDCDDKNPCTMDSCDPMTGCVHTPLNNVPCTSPDACITMGMCEMGVCQGVPVDCDDKNVCTMDGCDSATGCTHTPVDGTCDDMNACTQNDSCQNGICTGEALDCNDANLCTDDTCDPIKGCLHVDNTAYCDDGDPCTSNDTCAKGKCAGTPFVCDDNDECTKDICQGDGTCLFQPMMGCMSCPMDGVNVNCDDGDPCTQDSCSASGCRHDLVPGCCHAASDCLEGESCDNHECTSANAATKSGGCACTTPGGDRDGNGAVASIAFALAIAIGNRRRRR